MIRDCWTQTLAHTSNTLLQKCNWLIPILPWICLPASPHVWLQPDHGDQSDSWQLTGHSPTQDAFICHFLSRPSCKEISLVFHELKQNHLQRFKRQAVPNISPLCRTWGLQIYHHYAHSPACGFWIHFHTLLCHWADRYSILKRHSKRSA